MNADEIGRSYMREQLFAYITGVPGIARAPDPTWTKYIFDRKHADHRHARTIYRSTQRSVLSTLFEILNNDERGQIFTGVFELGNLREVPNEFQTYAALERELKGTLARGTAPENEDSILKPIKRQLQDLLGTPIKQYFDIDRGITLKVLKLLYRYHKGYNSNLCNPRLFSFLRLPVHQRPSFEFSGVSAVRDAIDKQRIIDELIVHLSSELDDNMRQEIRSTFVSLAYDVGVAEDALKRTFKAFTRSDVDRCRFAYSEALRALNHLRRTCGTDRTAQRLDIDLLVYLGRAQIENRNKAYAEVMDAINQLHLPLRQIEVDLIKLNAEFDKTGQGRDVNAAVTPLQGLGTFLSNWSANLRQIMEKAFGNVIKSDQYEAASENATKIIDRDLSFSSHVENLSLLDVVALLCTTHAAAEYQAIFRYKPYWHGQKNQSDRPFYPLNRRGPVDLGELPEGRIIYWRECGRRIKYALIDQLSYWELELELARCINDVLSQVMATHNIDAMQEFVGALKAMAA